MSDNDIAEIKRELRAIYKELQREGRGLEIVKLRVTILSQLIRLLELESGKELKRNDKKAY